MLIIRPCNSIIDKALECFSNHDSIGVCTNHRLGSETVEILGKMIRKHSGTSNDPGERLTVYHEYMLENTERIAETARYITTATDNYVPITYKCEIQTIRESLTRLMQHTDNVLRADDDTEIISDEINKEKDFIEHTIAIHSDRMNRDNYSDGDPTYSYLMLLYYLNSFVSSFTQAVKNIGINNKPMTA